LIRLLDRAQILTVSDVVFLVVTLELLLGEELVSSCQTIVTAQKRLHFSSDRWITPEFLQEFLEAIFHVVTIESLLCEANIRSRQTRVTPQKGSNF
jgi:hypothetical protein